MDVELLHKAKTYKQIYYAYYKRPKKPRDPATIKTNTFRVRLTDHELGKLQHFASTQGKNMSQVIHEYIHRLPNPANWSQETSD